MLIEPGGWIAEAALGLIGKSPRHEVEANLHRLKQLIETGKVTDMSYATPHKFDE